MPWRGHNGAFCHGCGKHRDEVGPLSARYKCEGCGEAAMLDNARQISASSGPYFERWRARMRAAFGIAETAGRALDDSRESR